MRKDIARRVDARTREYAIKWGVSPLAAARILASGRSDEGMDVLAIFARDLHAKRKAAVEKRRQSAA
jgi:hypothetical protein